VAGAFAFKDRELEFARSLLERHSSVWLYRTNQRVFAADFVAVDVSSPAVPRRLVFAIELKRDEPVRLHTRVGVQFRNTDRVVEDIALRGVVARDARLLLVSGDAGRMLSFLSRRQRAVLFARKAGCVPDSARRASGWPQRAHALTSTTRPAGHTTTCFSTSSASSVATGLSAA
jgi:hypothetical protein